MILLSVVCFVCLSSSQAQVTTTLDGLIASVFEEKPPEGKTPEENPPCTCMPYHKCIANATVVLPEPVPTPGTSSEEHHGEYLIDIRFGDKSNKTTDNRIGDNDSDPNGNRISPEDECDHYLDKCCIPRSPGITTTSTTTTTTTTTVRPDTHPTPPSSTPNPAEHQCGDRHPEGVGFRITGGNNNEANYGEFPWMVAVIRRDRVIEDVTLKIMECGGSIIHPLVILTAAHCVRGKRDLYIRAGEWDTQTEKEVYPTQDRDVKEVIIHEQYYAGGLHNDVALLILDQPLEMNAVVSTLCLPEQDESMDLRRCVVSGWGKDVFGKAGKYQVILKRVEQPIVQNDTCQTALRKTRLGQHFKLHDSFICAGGEVGIDACKGDGGGPLACPSNDDHRIYVQAGIVAWGIGCGTGTPAVYASVPRFRTWIVDKMASRDIYYSSE